MENKRLLRALLPQLKQENSTKYCPVYKPKIASPAVQVSSISGMGYAVISIQPAKRADQKRLMAIRAARLEATRDLTEKIHRLKVNSRTKMIDAIIQNEALRATVEGVVRGARTVRINPVGSDTYEVVLELDQDMIAHIMKAARQK